MDEKNYAVFLLHFQIRSSEWRQNKERRNVPTFEALKKKKEKKTGKIPFSKIKLQGPKIGTV